MSDDQRHLFIVIHGLLGNPTHVKFIADTIEKRLDKTDAFLPESNAGFLTFDGVEVCAKRILQEVEEFLAEQEESGVIYAKISVVGYSLGGLCGRYLLGLMDKKGLLDKYEPFSFTTFASPHAGSYFHRKASYGGMFNFLGSTVLGHVGKDLFFSNSGVLVELANPDGIFFKALKKFKHLMLFANTLHDRTVPFFTSYISDKDPFTHRDYLDTTLSSLEAGKDGKLLDQKMIDQYPPVFIDMAESKFGPHSLTGQNAKPTSEETTMKILMMIILPLMLPLLTGVTATMSIISHKRVSEFQRLEAAGKIPPAAKRNPNKKQRKELQAAVDDMAAAAVDAIDDVLPSSDDHHGTHSKPSAKSLSAGEFHPRPLSGDGYDGLIDSTPHNLDLPKEILQVIKNLNTLPWEKYAVRVQRMHSHAEIVNRRNKPGQGTLIVSHWVETLASKLLAADVKSDGPEVETETETETVTTTETNTLDDGDAELITA